MPGCKGISWKNDQKYAKISKNDAKVKKTMEKITKTPKSGKKTLEEADLEKINKLIITTVETKSGAKIRS